MTATSSPTVTLTWSVPRDLAARIAPAVANSAVTKKRWLADAVEMWCADVEDLEVASREQAQPLGDALLPREVTTAVAMQRAAQNRSVVATWTAFMVIARWPVDVLATNLGVSAEQVRLDESAGRFMLTSGGDMREVSRFLPPVMDPPEGIALPPSPERDQESTPVKAWVSGPVKARYQRKRALLGWTTTQTGCVVLMEALQRP